MQQAKFFINDNHKFELIAIPDDNYVGFLNKQKSDHKRECQLNTQALLVLSAKLSVEYNMHVKRVLLEDNKELQHEINKSIRSQSNTFIDRQINTFIDRQIKEANVPISRIFLVNEHGQVVLSHSGLVESEEIDQNKLIDTLQTKINQHF